MKGRILALVKLLRTESPSLVLVGRLGVAALGLINAPIIARSIGPSGRGETATAVAVYTVVPILLAWGVPLEIRRRSALDGGVAAIRAMRLIACIMFVPAGAIALALYFTLFSEFAASERLVASIGVALAPLMMCWMSDANRLIATKQFRAFAAVQLAQPAVYLVGVVIFWTLGLASTTTVLIANLVAMWGTFIMALAISRVSFRGDRVRILELLRGGSRFSGAAIADALSNRLDQVLALPLIGSQQAGLYSVAVTLATAPISVAHAIGAAYFGPVARANEAGRRRIKSQAFRSAAIVSLSISVIMILVVPVAVPLIFGSEFKAAVSITQVSLIGSAFMVVAYVCSVLLAAEGKGVRMTVAQCVSLAVAIGALFILGPREGAMGAALASSLGFVVLATMLTVAMRVPFAGLVPRPRDFRRAVSDLLKGHGDERG